MNPKTTLTGILSNLLLSDTDLPIVDDVLRIMRHNPVLTPLIGRLASRLMSGASIAAICTAPQ